MFRKKSICNFLLTCCYAALYAIFCTLQSARYYLFAVYCKFARNNMFFQIVDFKENQRIQRILRVFLKVLTCVRVESLRKMAFFLCILCVIDFKGIFIFRSNSATFGRGKTK